MASSSRHSEMETRPSGSVRLMEVHVDRGWVGRTVEQMEERERLRDRLAAVGEMAAVMAHEIKNPLAGIEVLAGLLRRKIPQSPDAQAVLGDIINEAKMANAIVQEVLAFVRPVRLQVDVAERPSHHRGFCRRRTTARCRCG